MENERYQVGDRVQLLVNHPDGNKVLMSGATGTVVHVSISFSVGVCWDVPRGTPGFHHCQHHCENGRGWYVSARNLAKAMDLDLDDLI